MQYHERLAKQAVQLEQVWATVKPTDPSPLLLDADGSCRICLPWQKRFGINSTSLFDLNEGRGFEWADGDKTRYEVSQWLQLHESEIHFPIRFITDRLPEYLNQFLQPQAVMIRNMLTYSQPTDTRGSNEPARAYFLLNGHRIGKIRTAEMAGNYEDRDSELSLIDDDSRRIALGSNSGYGGHGPSGTLTILRLSGFPEGRTLDPRFQTTELENLVHTKPGFTLYRGI